MPLATIFFVDIEQIGSRSRISFVLLSVNSINEVMSEKRVVNILNCKFDFVHSSQHFFNP